MTLLHLDLVYKIPFIGWSVRLLTAVFAYALLDVVGLLCGWQWFGHVAHLSGTCFGFLYAVWGQGLWIALIGAWSDAFELL